MLRAAFVASAALIAAVLIGAEALHARPASPVRFGAFLTTSSEPANAESGRTCAQAGGISAGTCTWVSIQAYHNAGHERAPKTGTIGKVRLVSCVPGSFRLQFARLKGTKAKIVRNGPLIRYKGDPRQPCGGENGEFQVQTFSVKAHVNKGDYIAIQTSKTGTLYCSGGSGITLYSPPLGVGGSYRASNTRTSCNLLVQLQYK